MKLWNQEVERIITMRPVSGKDGNLEWDNREDMRARVDVGKLYLIPIQRHILLSCDDGSRSR